MKKYKQAIKTIIVYEIFSTLLFIIVSLALYRHVQPLFCTSGVMI